MLFDMLQALSLLKPSAATDALLSWRCSIGERQIASAKLQAPNGKRHMASAKRQLQTENAGCFALAKKLHTRAAVLQSKLDQASVLHIWHGTLLTLPKADVVVDCLMI